MQLIPTGSLHIRRPLLERRFARSTAMQLKAVAENVISERTAMQLGPTLTMEETENGELQVTIGMHDPEHVLLDTDFPGIVLTLDPTGSASEVRARVAAAIQEQTTLTHGLRKFLTDIVLGLRPAPASEDSQDADEETAADDGPKDAELAPNAPDAEDTAGTQRRETAARGPETGQGTGHDSGQGTDSEQGRSQDRSQSRSQGKSQDRSQSGSQGSTAARPGNAAPARR